MDARHLKKYAPVARRDFIDAVKNKAAVYGLLPNGEILPMQEEGDVFIIGDRPFPRFVAKQRMELEDRIRKKGFQQFIEAIAYTWFNRFVAIRFMELHGYLDHGYRVLSHPEGKPIPEILEHAERIKLPGLNRDKIIDLKLEGSKDEQLYQMLLLAQCNALHKAMPFLFESISDGTELLLPENLLHTNSLVRTLVNDIPEEQWQQVEIIGWLYQFYISEKKDDVIGTVVASEDIPAATQLFTPNWIVKYLVQNTLGRQWLATYPQSALRQQMHYYIEPGEQSPEVLEQLKAITPTSLNPEELTLLDPACGSGHILVEAYDLFRLIYQERGYRAKDIPALILQKNLFGLEIDDRAAQLAAFALTMKARADDHRIFECEAKPNILAFQESKDLDAAEIFHALQSPIRAEDDPPSKLPPPADQLFETEDNLFTRAATEVVRETSTSQPSPLNFTQADIAGLLALFENAKTFGSLIQIPPKLAMKLPEIEKRLDDVLKHGDLTHSTAGVIEPLLRQARILVRQYDAVVANPPYMGRRSMNPALYAFAKAEYPEGKLDLFSCFLLRGMSLAKPLFGRNGMVVMESWMFLPTFDELRLRLLSETTLASVVHMPYEGKGRTTMGIAFGTAAAVFPIIPAQGYKSHFCCVRHTDLSENGVPFEFPVRNERLRYMKLDLLRGIPGRPIAYWVNEPVARMFETGISLEDVAQPRQGIATSDNNRFLRQWFEVDASKVGFSHGSAEEAKAAGVTWVPYSKGGEFRRWYGNNSLVINWKNDGAEVFAHVASIYGSPTRSIRNLDRYFQPAITWSLTCSSDVGFAARSRPKGFIFDVNGMSAFPEQDADYILAVMNSKVAYLALKVINPTWSFQAGDIARIPYRRGKDVELCASNAMKCVRISKEDWDSVETSWEFVTLPLLRNDCRSTDVSKAIQTWSGQCAKRIEEMKTLEEANNRLLIDAYELQEEIDAVVQVDRINLLQADREEDIKRLISYAIGCMMGRYSLDKPGLIYAHSGNKDFDASHYTTFRADDDGIVPLFETDWGIRDDLVNRIVEFIGVAWPKEHLEVNLKFIADSLGPTSNEQSRDTIRRYLVTGFYKHHLSMYKKRPIYWQFSSGKQRAFQCLVYLHRYHEGTLSRMRTEYVVKLQSQINSRIERLADEIAASSSTSQRKIFEKERDKLIKQREELLSFDEKLRHCADQRIALDLDEGVKINYGKFGDLLAEVKSIIANASE